MAKALIVEEVEAEDEEEAEHSVWAVNYRLFQSPLENHCDVEPVEEERV